MDQPQIILRYIGQASLPGIPARDLTQADIAEIGSTIQQLVKSGLYERVQVEKPRPTNNKLAQGGEENKGA